MLKRLKTLGRNTLHVIELEQIICLERSQHTHGELGTDPYVDDCPSMEITELIPTSDEDERSE